MAAVSHCRTMPIGRCCTVHRRADRICRGVASGATIALITFYDALLARLLIASGQLPEAQERLQTGLDLAERTRMHFYDAELMRLRARTTDDTDTRRRS